MINKYVKVTKGIFKGEEGFIRKIDKKRKYFFICNNDGLMDHDIGWVKPNEFVVGRKRGFFESLYNIIRYKDWECFEVVE